ncbi:MAG TPA: SCO family protein [Pseudomonadales bacterium]|nr:SCO family protein [Pseudomonadales bacterium]
MKSVRYKALSGLLAGLLLIQSAWAELPVNPRLGGDFSLSSTLDHPAALADFKGKVVLLNFGYTSCPDVCPMVVSRMTQVMKALGDKADAVQPLFVSFDGERDTVEKLRAYLNYFDPRFIGMTGSAEQIAAVAKQYGVIYIKQEQGSAGVFYSHSDFIYLLDQQGRVRALYANDVKTDRMKSDIESLLAEPSETKPWWKLW